MTTHNDTYPKDPMPSHNADSAGQCEECSEESAWYSFELPGGGDVRLCIEHGDPLVGKFPYSILLPPPPTGSLSGGEDAN